MASVFRVLSVVSLTLIISGTAYSRPISRDGGVSGGGGNVINPTPPERIIDGDSVEHVVKASVAYTRLYFKNVHAQYLAGELPSDINPVFEKLFADRDHFVRVLEEVRPHVVEETPCYDRGMNPVDASIVSGRPGRFCVSAYSMARKVHVDEIPIQSAALMAHEYSELVGLNEDDAVTVQKKALEDLKNSDLPPLKAFEE